MKQDTRFAGLRLLSVLLGLLVLAALSSCARKESAQAPAAQTPAAQPAGAQQADPPSSPLPDSLTALLKKAGFAVAAKPFPADDFALGTLDGSRASLSSFKGKVVLLSFWATWCGPCKQELPSIEALYNKLSARGFAVVAVDIGEQKDKVAQFVKANKLTFPVLLDTDMAIGTAWEASSIPTNYLVDRSGRVIARVVGFDGIEWTNSGKLDLFDKILSM